MARYRIGNDMTILWAINDRNGAALPLNDKEVHLYYTCARGRYEADIEIQDDNVVVWNFLGNKQRVLGSYTLTLEILQSRGKRTIKKDICNAFVLVGKDCEEDYDNGEAHISEGREITLASKLDIYRISPVIPYVVRDENGVAYWYVDGVNTGDRSTGESAYEYALTKGFEGTEAEFAVLMADTPNVSKRLTELESEVSKTSIEVSKASIKESTFDFSISDEQGNAIMGIANGHIKTKNFDSRIESRHYGSFSIIGDSYSTFADKTTPTTNKQWYPTNIASAEGYNSGNDVVSLEQTWWYLFANEYKSVLLENNSYSGATICYDGYSEGHDSFAAKISFCKRIEEMQSKPELLFVFGGTNDAWAKSEIGSYKYSDWTEDDKSYFRPALAYLIDYVRTNMIGTTIIFILNNGLKSDITDSVRVICEHYGVRVVELEDIDKISSHPSIRGMEQIKEQLIKVI